MAEKKPPLPVEFLLAHEDGTWSTKVFKVPAWVVAGKSKDSPKWRHEVMKWAHDTIFKMTEYRKTVHISIYSTDPENMGSAWQEDEDGQIRQHD
jgi:hypothetical protein